MAPPKLPGFTATMSPSDSQTSRLAVMFSRPTLANGLHAGGHSPGSLRFLTALSMPAVPSHPGKPTRCACSLLRGWLRASPFSEGWPLSIGVTRPKRVQLILRLVSSRREAPAEGSLPQPPAQLHGERTTTTVSSLQLTRTIRLNLTHRKHETGGRLAGGMLNGEEGNKRLPRFHSSYQPNGRSFVLSRFRDSPPAASLPCVSVFRPWLKKQKIRIT